MVEEKIEYLELPNQVTAKGIGCPSVAYTLDRFRDVCMYVRYDVSDELKKHPIYEVFKVRRIKDRVLPNGVLIEARELYPSNEDFGKTAWCYTKEHSARKRFEELKTKENESR